MKQKKLKKIAAKIAVQTVKILYKDLVMKKKTKKKSEPEQIAAGVINNEES